LNHTLLRRAAPALFLLAAGAAHAQRQDALVQLLNAYRAAPGNCAGRAAGSAPPLVLDPALARVSIASGLLLEHVLERAGYPVARAEAIAVAGAPDAPAALAAITRKHCKALLDPAYVAAGASLHDGEWLLVLAQPAPPPVARERPDPATAGALVLAAVNAARALARTCGARAFAPAPALAWNEQLAQAAQMHSSDMAVQRYFNHQGKDGRAVSERATQAGYRWRLVGENIAAGQDSSDQVVAGWLDSPGHCANIMNPAFTEMGSAFAISGNPATGRAYWTQVLGAPR
jgi:uncharacterized protein YkwD